MIGLDELWLMVHHQHGRKESELWQWLLARKAAALLTDEFFAAGIEAVIVNGPFFTDEERARYLEHVRGSTRRRNACVSLPLTTNDHCTFTRISYVRPAVTLRASTASGAAR